MKRYRYLFLISFVNFIYYFEIVGFRMLLFPHLVNEINKDTAQRDFAIGQCLYRTVPLLTNFFAGIIVDRTGMSRGMLFIYIVTKMVYLAVYIITKDIHLIMTVLIAAGFTNGIQAISIGEIKRNVDENQLDRWLNMVMMMSCVGGLTAGLIHLLPDSFTITINSVNINQDTLVFFVIELVYLFYLPLYVVISKPPPTDQAVYGLITEDNDSEPMNDKEIDHVVTKARVSSSCKVIATSFLYSFNVALVWELGAFSCVEYSKKLQLPHYVSGLFFTFRYLLAGLFNRIFSHYLSKTSSSDLLTAFISIRELCLVLMIISTLCSNLSLSITLFAVSNVFLSIMHFFDQSTVQKILWRYNKNISLMAILISSAKSAGYMFAFTIPLCFNFIELIQCMTFVLLACNHVLFVNTAMV